MDPVLHGPVPPESMGLSAAGLESAANVYRNAVADPDSGQSAASIVVARHGNIVLAEGFGRQSPQGGAAVVGADSIFMMASVTKPVTTLALMMLVDDGSLSLEDKVWQHLPEFSDESDLERSEVTVRDLVAHTSGLPDMLPENAALREARAPLSEFTRLALKTPLLFPPGADFLYQSSNHTSKLQSLPQTQFSGRFVKDCVILQWESCLPAK